MEWRPLPRPTSPFPAALAPKRGQPGTSVPLLSVSGATPQSATAPNQINTSGQDTFAPQLIHRVPPESSLKPSRCPDDSLPGTSSLGTSVEYFNWPRCCSRLQHGNKSHGDVAIRLTVSLHKGSKSMDDSAGKCPSEHASWQGTHLLTQFSHEVRE